MRIKEHPEYHPLAGEIFLCAGATESASGWSRAGLIWLDGLHVLADYRIEALEKSIMFCECGSRDAPAKIKQIRSFVNFAEHADREEFRVALVKEYESLEKELYA